MCMKKLVKYFRSIWIVNWPIRKLIKYSPFNNLLSKHWPIQGVDQVNILGQKVRFYSNCDDHLFSRLYYNTDSFESDELKLLFRLNKDIKTFIDVGANTGLYSILVGKLNPGIDIFAFEPHPQNFCRLKKNLELNGITRAKLFQSAVGALSKQENFYIPANTSVTDVSSFSQEFSERMAGTSFEAIDVRTITLDNQLLRKSLSQDILVKIDVEGFELEVIKGGLSFAEKCRPLIICEIFTKYFKSGSNYRRELPKVYQLEQLMRQLDYQTFQIKKDGFLEKISSLNYNTANNNVLFVPSENSLLQDLDRDV